MQSDVVIDVPAESQLHKQVIRKRAEARDIVMDPSVRLFYAEVAEPDMHDPTGDFERLVNAVHESAPRAKICFNTNPGDTAEAIQRWA